MLRRILPCLVIALFTACPGDTIQQIDGSTTGGPDAPGATCTRAIYDNCITDPQCESNNCQIFNPVNLHICTMICTTSADCPMKDGAAVPCVLFEGTKFCKPPRSTGCDPA